MKVLIGYPWTIGLDMSPGETEVRAKEQGKETAEEKDYSFDDLLREAGLYQRGPCRITIEEGKLTIELMPN